MAPPKRPWFRFYAEAATDPKLRRLTPAQRWLWVAVLCAARQSPRPGYLMLTDRIPLADSDIADGAGMAVKDVSTGLAAMEALGLIEQDGDAWRVSKWSERQFESDGSSERVKKHRHTEDDGTSMERRCNGLSPLQDERCNDEVTPPETETENRDRKQENARPDDGEPDGFAEFWDAYPRRVSKGQARRAYRTALKRGASPSLIVEKAKAYARQNLEEKYTAHPSTWLNGERYNDEYPEDTSVDGVTYIEPKVRYA